MFFPLVDGASHQRLWLFQGTTNLRAEGSKALKQTCWGCQSTQNLVNVRFQGNGTVYCISKINIQSCQPSSKLPDRASVISDRHHWNSTPFITPHVGQSTRRMKYSTGRKWANIDTRLQGNLLALFVLLFGMRSSKGDCIFYSPRCCGQTGLGTTVNKYSEAHKQEELTRRHMAPYKM